MLAASGIGCPTLLMVALSPSTPHGPEIYEDEIRRFCGYKKLSLARLYSDIDYSAFRGAKPRPSLEQLVADRSNYSAIIVPKLSRFGRSMKELIRLFDVFDSDRIPLVFLDMNLDTSTSQDRLLRRILAAFAEYESDVKADYSSTAPKRSSSENSCSPDLAPVRRASIDWGDEPSLAGSGRSDVWDIHNLRGCQNPSGRSRPRGMFDKRAPLRPLRAARTRGKRGRAGAVVPRNVWWRVMRGH